MYCNFSIKTAYVFGFIFTVFHLIRRSDNSAGGLAIIIANFRFLFFKTDCYSCSYENQNRNYTITYDAPMIDSFYTIDNELASRRRRYYIRTQRRKENVWGRRPSFRISAGPK